uniref:Uncharacterized protein n=1 Tax=Setaria italica TaxID=4555 RepID=K4ANV9_SETIT
MEVDSFQVKDSSLQGSLQKDVPNVLRSKVSKWKRRLRARKMK